MPPCTRTISDGRMPERYAASRSSSRFLGRRQALCRSVGSRRIAAISPYLPVEQRSVGWLPPPVLWCTSLTLPSRWTAFASLFHQILYRPRASSPVRRNDEDRSRRGGNMGHEHTTGATSR